MLNYQDKYTKKLHAIDETWALIVSISWPGFNETRLNRRVNYLGGLGPHNKSDCESVGKGGEGKTFGARDLDASPSLLSSASSFSFSCPPTTMPDVEMKPADNKDDKKKKDEKKEEKKEKKEEPPKPPPTPVQEIKYNVVLIERAVATMEPRFAHRALRTLTGLRRRLDDVVLRNAVNEVFVKGTRRSSLSARVHLLGQLRMSE
jgi:hypothetical protein